jgi:anthranilate phosphoribosyltransferase
MTTASDQSPLQAAIVKLAHHSPISTQDATDAFGVIMRGEATSLQVAAMLTGLRVRGETAEIVAGVVRAMREVMVHLKAEDADALVDTCGTGGGALTTFNISTAAALLAAGAGVRIAKHGNRSFTSRCGSADVLEALGVAIDVPLETMERALDLAGIVFMYAPLMHPAMRHVGAVRRELAIPTVMNVVGALANPAGARRQVVGVADPQRALILAGALLELDTLHSLVVHGEPGLDEISPLGLTRVVEVRGGTTSEWTIDPTEFGYSGFTAAELAGGDLEDNARIINDILGGRIEGRATAGARAAVVMNAAAAIYVSGRVPTYAEGIAAAQQALDSGAALMTLDRLREAHGRRPTSSGE